MRRSVEQRYEDFKALILRHVFYSIVLLATAALVSLWLWQFSPWLIIFPIAVSGLLIFVHETALSVEVWEAIECDMELDEFIEQHPISYLAEIRRIMKQHGISYLAAIRRTMTPAKIRLFFSPTQSMTGFIKICLGWTLAIILGGVLGRLLDEILGLKPGTTLIYVIGPFLLVLFGYLAFTAYQETRKLRNKLGDDFVDNDGW